MNVRTYRASKIYGILGCRSEQDRVVMSTYHRSAYLLIPQGKHLNCTNNKLTQSCVPVISVPGLSDVLIHCYFSCSLDSQGIYTVQTSFLSSRKSC